MKNNQHAGSPPAITLGDIYFVLFRHKWKIILLAAAGIVAAIIYHLLNPPLFQSEAKLFIRYVLDTRSPNTAASNTSEISPAASSESIINSEIQILTSFDVAEEAATHIGPEKILAEFGGGGGVAQAANVIKTHLTVDVPAGSSVIDITFYHPDPALVQPTLAEIIADYMKKYQEVHQATGASDDFLMEETVQLRSQISQTENELRAAKTSAGFVSVEQAEKFYGEQIAKIREELYEDGAELAEHQVKLGPTDTNALTTVTAEIPAGQLEEFREVCARLEFLRQQVTKYLTQDGFTEENQFVEEARAQIDETTKRQKTLEQEFPALASLNFSTPDSFSPTSSISGIAVEAVPLPTKINVLKQQLDQIQNEAAGVDDAESKISDLQLEKQVEDGNYQNFAASLEQARINEALGAGGLSNISPIQSPSPPFTDFSKERKVMLAMIFGGIFSGIALAFLIEFYFDTSVKRSVEVESQFKMPLFLSIPDISRNGHRHLALADAAKRKLLVHHSGNGANGHGSVGILSPGTGGFLNPFYDALRDRLMTYFETINLTCKPKLVAVTGTDKGSGVSTIAAGLAASLSETGNGRVLLVDMNHERGAARQFFSGAAGCQLDDALMNEKRDTALVQENLYVVTEGFNEKLQRVLPKRFASLVPKLKASDYDYIIFDMPPVSQTSVTSRLAGLMDMTLLVIVSEKTGRDAVQQAHALLSFSKATVGAVLNKTRKYIPDRLHRGSLGDV
jgi:polysaccharide biosynthesis transport protein